MIYLYLFGTCFHFIYVFMIIGKYISNIWWTLQGIIISGWGLVGLFSEYNNVYAELLLAGLFLIVSIILKTNRSYNIRILSQICLILYTIITSILIFMLVAVASPKVWCALVLLIIGTLNILISIVDSFKIFYAVKEWFDCWISKIIGINTSN